MFHLLEELVDSGLIIPFVAVGGTFSWLIVMTSWAFAARMSRNWQQTQLTMAMLDRGMPAEEIMLVLKADRRSQRRLAKLAKSRLASKPEKASPPKVACPRGSMPSFANCA